MVKKKVCKKCKIFVDSGECPLCKGKSFTTNWQGRVTILDAKKSMIAEKIGTEKEGEYSIKSRQVDINGTKDNQQKTRPFIVQDRD